MPLLRRQPFHKEKIPHDLRPEEEVFHCKITNEIFRDYDAFFERIILCNSLVWSCSITGKSGMTFQEAEESEKKAKKNLATFEDYLKRPLLYLATLTQRTKINDLNDDVFVFAKDRFFIGESVFYHESEQKRVPCKIVGVVPPPPEEKKGGDIIVIDDSDEDSRQGPSENKSEKKKKSFGADPTTYKYKVKLQGSDSVITSSALTLSRKRNHYTRDRSKLFLKQSCDLNNGLWTVKLSAIRKMHLAMAKYEDFFAGPKPNFEKTLPKRPGLPKLPNGGPARPEPPKGPSPAELAEIKEKMRLQRLEEMKKIKEEKEAIRERMRKQIEEDKIRRKEEKERERLKRMEEKRKELELF